MVTKGGDVVNLSPRKNYLPIDKLIDDLRDLCVTELASNLRAVNSSAEKATAMMFLISKEADDAAINTTFWAEVEKYRAVSPMHGMAKFLLAQLPKEVQQMIGHLRNEMSGALEILATHYKGKLDIQSIVEFIRDRKGLRVMYYEWLPVYLNEKKRDAERKHLQEQEDREVMAKRYVKEALMMLAERASPTTISKAKDDDLLLKRGGKLLRPRPSDMQAVLIAYAKATYLDK